MKTDCSYFNNGKCTILKKLYCKKEKCSFYKQDITKEVFLIEPKEIKKTKKQKDAKKIEEQKKKKREYSKQYYQKHKICKENNIKYKNYGDLYFSDEEIYKLKNGILKIK